MVICTIVSLFCFIWSFLHYINKTLDKMVSDSNDRVAFASTGALARSSGSAERRGDGGTVMELTEM